MFKICIDPGHGSRTNGYIGHPGFCEGAQMFKLAQYQKEELEKYAGVEVILTRKTITDDPSLDARGKMAAGCDLFYSDHSNAADSSGNWSSARGVDIYSSHRKPNADLCARIGAAVSAAMSNSFRGTKYRDYDTGATTTAPQAGALDYYGVIRSAAATSCTTAIIVEHGFHTNQQDVSFLVDDNNLRALAKAEAQAIADYYGLTLADNPAPSGDTYTVQKGDCLSVIGAKLGLDWRDIAAVNGITEPYTIYAGQILQLSGGQPAPAPAPQPTTGYKIGDHVVFSTCYRSSTAPIEEHLTAARMLRNHGVITRIVDGARNPYLLDDNLCWVNDGDIRGYYRG